jgi:hypothetical protein
MLVQRFEKGCVSADYRCARIIGADVTTNHIGVQRDNEYDGVYLT